jgi:hypothetical protein
MLNFLKILNNTKIYYLLLTIIIVFNSWISFENITFNLYFNSSYEEYSNFFKSLDFNVFSFKGSTFPIWGYGIVHLFGKNIFLTLFIQQFITFLTLIYLDNTLIRLKKLDSVSLFRFLILISFPWFLFHTQMWPKSFASNLFIISVFELLKFINKKNYKNLFLSAFCFGIMLNFRSDYIYLFYLITIFVFISKPFSFIDSIKKTIFPVSVLCLLIPWMVFSYYQTGKPLLTSTNSGHVLFSGLGQLPNNIWGITPYDEDSLKTKLLIEKFGDKYKSLEFEAWNGIEEDKFLKQVFFNLVIENSKEWIKKCFFSFRLLVLDPFYVGNVGNYQQNKFSNIIEIRKLEKFIYQFKLTKATELIKETTWELSFKEVFQFIYTLIVKVIGVTLMFSFLFISIITLIRKVSIIFSDPFLYILSLIVIYQMSISVFAFHMPVYNTLSYIFYLLLTYLLFQKYLSTKQ